MKSNYKNYTISAINYLDFYDNLLIFKYRHTNSLQIVIKIYNNFYDKNFLISELINKANSRLLCFFIERKKKWCEFKLSYHSCELIRASIILSFYNFVTVVVRKSDIREC